MKIILKTTTIDHKNNTKVTTTEKIKKDDLRIENAENRNSNNSWGVMGYDYEDKCEKIKYGYKVTQVELYNKDKQESIIKYFRYE